MFAPEWSGASQATDAAFERVKAWWGRRRSALAEFDYEDSAGTARFAA